MCNEYTLRIDFGKWWDQQGRAQPPLVRRDPPSNRPLNQPFKPTNRASLLRPVDPADPMAGLECVERRWWLVPFFHKGPVSAWKSMCTNARIETIDTAPTFREAYRRRRALLPITSFVEYDEPPGWKKGQPKRRWEVTWDPADDFDQVRYFAGVWERSGPSDLEEPLESFAFVTGPPGPDVGAVHDRQPAVLSFDQGLEWLRLDGPGKAALVTETPAGTYRLTERARELDRVEEGGIGLSCGGPTPPQSASPPAPPFHGGAQRYRCPLPRSGGGVAERSEVTEGASDRRTDPRRSGRPTPAASNRRPGGD